MTYGQVSGGAGAAYCGLPQFSTAVNRSRFVRFTAVPHPPVVHNVEIDNTRPKEQFDDRGGR
jgi:hypothetical protein